MTDPTPDNVRPIRPHLPARMPPPAQPGTALEGPVYQGELVDDLFSPAGEREPARPVDQPTEAAPWVPPWEIGASRRPVVEPWLRDSQERRFRAEWMARYAWHTTLFHAARLPLYGARVLLASPRGASRSVAGAGRWVSSAELAEAAQAARSDPTAMVRLLEMRRQRAASRSALLLLAATALCVPVVATGGVLRWLLLLGLLAVLGIVGRREGRPIVSTAVDRPRVTKLTGPIVIRALNAAGLNGRKAKKTEDEDTAVGTASLVRDPVREGKGWAVTVDLPYGKTSEQAVERHKQIASGLDVGAVQLFLDVVPDRERRLGMWVADADPYAGRPNPSPNARCPRVSVWEPQRLGVDPRGRVVALPLIFNGFVVGSIPRQGKTFCVRNLVAPAILDPHCDVTVLGAKSSDWEDAEGICVSYSAGEGDDVMVEYSVAALRRLVAESQAAYDSIRALPKGDRPEGKITPELQARGFRPHVIVVEEAQNIFGHRDESGVKRSPLAKQALYYATQLAKVGPAAGYILILATQRPSAEVIPTDLRDVLSVRIALKVNDRASSDTILGDYRSARGIESASLLNEVHRGVSTVVGVDNGRGGDHTRMRGDLLTAEQFGRVCTVGRQRRVDAGTLRGHAAGEADPIQIQVSLLDDLLAVFPNGEDAAWSETLCARLARLRPELYTGWQPTALTSALKGLNVTAGRQVWGTDPETGKGANRRGVFLEDIAKAAESRR
jgi:DNA segregation ATPase FtsK/SpoIIIE, S-DNA-T family